MSIITALKKLGSQRGRKSILRQFNPVMSRTTVIEQTEYMITNSVRLNVGACVTE